MGAKRDPSVGNMAGARRGTQGSERRTSSVSPLAAVAPLTCGFLHPAQLLWSGGHFPLEGEGVTLAVCGGRGGRGRAGGRAVPAACHKGKGCLAAPAPGGGRGSEPHRWEPAVVGRWWGAGTCSSGWAASFLAVGAEGRAWGKVVSNADWNRVAEEQVSYGGGGQVSGLLARILRVVVGCSVLLKRLGSCAFLS